MPHNVNHAGAIRWLGIEEVFAFLDLGHSDEETDHSVIYLPTDGSKVEPGDWIVRNADGDLKALTDEAYRAQLGPDAQAATR